MNKINRLSINDMVYYLQKNKRYGEAERLFLFEMPLSESDQIEKEAIASGVTHEPNRNPFANKER